MKLEFTLDKLATKAGVILVATCLCGLLILSVIANFIAGMLSDERVNVSGKALQAAADYFPSSARLHSRLAGIMEQQGDLSQAESHILRAIALSPYNYNFRLMLASIEESRGDRRAAEQSLRVALKLAPNKGEVHWNLANVLLRSGELDRSLEAFRAASALKKSFLPVTLNLIWRASNGSLVALENVAGDEPGARITLAGFLLNHSRVKEAGEVFNTLDRKARLTSAESAGMLNVLIDSNHLELARSLWAGTIEASSPDRQLISNGSFESDALKGFAQFDWIINLSDYAKVTISNGNAHTGARSLCVEFAGRDTTRLDNEVQQLVVAQPGLHYRLECYAKAEGLVTSEGPHIVVTTTASREWLAWSEPVATRSDWQHLVIDFVAPNSVNGGAVGLYVSIKRKPKFSYDEPTRGRIYFDDFTLTEQGTASSGRSAVNRHQ